MNKLKLILIATSLGACIGMTNAGLLASVSQTQDLTMPADARLRSVMGLAMPTQQVTLSAPVEAVLIRLDAEDGQTVEAGRTLFVLDDRVSRAAVEAARVRASSTAEIERSEAQLKDAEQNHKRLVELAAKNAASKRDLADAELTLARSQAEHRLAVEKQQQEYAQLKLEEARLDQLHVKAPFAGVVVDRMVEPGTSLRVADPVLLLVDTSSLVAEMNLPLHLVPAEVGREYVLRAELADEQLIVGRLEMKSPVIDAASQTVRCRFRIDNSAGALTAGFGVSLQSLTPLPVTPLTQAD